MSPTLATALTLPESGSSWKRSPNDLTGAVYARSCLRGRCRSLGFDISSPNLRWRRSSPPKPYRLCDRGCQVLLTSGVLRVSGTENLVSEKNNLVRNRVNKGGPTRYGNTLKLTSAQHTVPEYQAGRLRLSRQALLGARSSPPPTIRARASPYTAGASPYHRGPRPSWLAAQRGEGFS